MKKWLLILFIFLSFITHPISEYDPSGNPIFGRLTYGDLFGFMAILFGINDIFKGLLLSLKINKIYLYAFIFILLLFTGVFLSLNRLQTLVEILVHLFLVLLSILIFYNFKDKLFSGLIPLIILTTLAAALFGFYDLFADLYGLPRLFPGRTEAEAVSGFRNAGQAGAYFMIMLTILFPIYKSNLKSKLSPFFRKLLSASIILGIIFLFSTGKIAGYIGFAIGYTLFTFFNPKPKNILILLIMGLSFTYLFYNLESIYPALYKRLNDKIETRIVQQVEGTSRSNFFQSNWGGAIQSFRNNPITGTGIGGFGGIVKHYEVHSTYLKILGETGIVGAIGYLLFVYGFLSIFKTKYWYSKDVEVFIKYSLPFIIGDFVSWAYTYHMRKREFWLLVSFLLIILYQSKRYYYLQKANDDDVR